MMWCFSINTILLSIVDSSSSRRQGQLLTNVDILKSSVCDNNMAYMILQAYGKIQGIS